MTSDSPAAEIARQPYLADRLQGYGSTVFAEMTVLANDTGSFNLGQGFPDMATPSEVLDAAAAAMRDGINQYTHPLGEPVLRDAIAEHQQRFWGIEVDPASEVLVTCGATEAIAAAILALIEPGDEVLMFEPYFDSYSASVAMAGGVRRVITLYEPTEERPDWHFDPDEVAAAIGPRTKAMLLNTPHNPTGKVFAVEELEFLGGLAQHHDLVVISDEVYEHLAYDRPHIPITTLDGMGERTLTISSAGKTLSCTGWKVGWICGPSELVAAVKAAKQFLTYVNGGPLQYGAAAGLRLGDDYFDGLRAGLVERRDRLSAGLRSAGFTVPAADGGYFVMTDATEVGAASAREMALEMPHRIGVVAIPSDVFYDDVERGRRFLRWAFCKDDAVIDGAVSALGRWR